MKEIDAVIDKQPTEQRIIDLAEQRNRNLMAFKELQNFNDTGKWLNQHPLLAQHSTRYQLTELLRKNPAEYLDEFAKTAGYVARYKSYLNNEKRTDEQKEKDKINLKKHAEREQIMKEVLDERKPG